MADEIVIRPMVGEHADAVPVIFQAGLDTGHASFEYTAPDWGGWDRGHA